MSGNMTCGMYDLVGKICHPNPFLSTKAVRNPLSSFPTQENLNRRFIKAKYLIGVGQIF